SPARWGPPTPPAPPPCSPPAGSSRWATARKAAFRSAGTRSNRSSASSRHAPSAGSTGGGSSPSSPARAGTTTSSYRRDVRSKARRYLDAPSELDDRVLAVAHVHGVDEADHAPAVRHQHRARADATAEEADAPHEGAVGDAGGGEEDVGAGGQVLLRVDALH